MKWTLTGADDFSAVIREGDQVVGVVGYHTGEDKTNARCAVIAPEALAILELIVREEEARYEKAYVAASYHNNSDGVGVYFDYETYPTHPEWFNEAKDIIAKAHDKTEWPVGE